MNVLATRSRAAALALLVAGLGGCGAGETVALHFSRPIEIIAAPSRGAPPPPAEPPPEPASAPPPAPAAAPPPAPAAPEAPPTAAVTKTSITISERIQFDPSTSTIRASSYPLLDAIATAIKTHPQIKKLQVEGHASPDGAAKVNAKLASDRAKAVVKALVSRGVSAGILVASTAGGDKPLGDNSTAEGREQNRRVEFHILESSE